MILVQTIALPFLFGLVGFIEPCSLGVNLLFLASTRHAGAGGRLAGLLLFMAVRAGLLALLGGSVAFLGGWLFAFEAWVFVAIGTAYVAAGAWLLLGRGMAGAAAWSLRLPLVALDGSRRASPLLLGLLAGATIPACAIPLVAVLLGGSLLAGQVAAGVLSLLVFGITLTAPLAFFLFHPQGRALLVWLFGRAARFRRPAGAVVMLIGVLTIASGSYWIGASPRG